MQRMFHCLPGINYEDKYEGDKDKVAHDEKMVEIIQKMNEVKTLFDTIQRDKPNGYEKMMEELVNDCFVPLMCLFHEISNLTPVEYKERGVIPRPEKTD